jgi:hypothetical protein
MLDDIVHNDFAHCLKKDAYMHNSIIIYLTQEVHITHFQANTFDLQKCSKVTNNKRRITVNYDIESLTECLWLFSCNYVLLSAIIGLFKFYFEIKRVKKF